VGSHHLYHTGHLTFILFLLPIINRGYPFFGVQTEKTRLQAEAKAAEEARKQAEAEEAKRRRAEEREAARQALQQVIFPLTRL
jgi:hypothetical protein